MLLSNRLMLSLFGLCVSCVRSSNYS